MGTIKVFSLGGLDKKSNDLTRSPEKASDMLNMEYDTQSALKKRNGYSEYSTEDCDDCIFYAAKKEKLLFKNGSSSVVIIKEDNTTKTLALPYGISSMSNISISSCESQGNIYITNTDYSTYVMKYDGSNLYRAGLPTPRRAQSSGIDSLPTFSGGIAGGGYSRIFYKYKDINGNVTYSPYIQYDYIYRGGSFDINTLRPDSTTRENGFLDKYCFVVKTGSGTISSSSRTLTVTKHNYVAGDKFLIDKENRAISISPSYKSFITLDVESVTATTITFTSASFNGASFSLANFSTYYTTEYPVDIRTQVEVFTSSSSDTGFTRISMSVLDNSSVHNAISPVDSDRVLVNGLPSPISFEDVYDSTTSKIMPPICKYIATFGSQIAYTSIKSFFTSFDSSSVSAPNQRVEYSNDDLLVYSDISAGDGPEGVSELNLDKIGETWDGQITGAKRCNDSLVIFKDRGVFSIDGTLISGEYQIRKMNTNFVGCTSHRSIIDSDDGLYFQGHDGIYFTNGVGVRKMTYEIDYLFPSGSYLTTRAVRLKKKQKALFYVQDLSKIVVIDYYYNQIYIWDNIDASKGFFDDTSGDVFFSNGSSIFKIKNDGESNQYSDNGSAISAYYSTTWHHADEPSLNKKWLSLRAFALTTDVFTLGITAQGDWDESANIITTSIPFASADQTKFLMFDMKTKRSFRIKFSNSTLNENLSLTGYELTYEPFNNQDKGN